MLGLGNIGRIVFGRASDRRVKRYRPDKTPEQADTVDHVRAHFERSLRLQEA